MKRFLSTILVFAFTLAAWPSQGQGVRSESMVTIEGETFYIHTVTRQDNIASLSKLYGVPELDIIRYNPHAAAGTAMGQKVKIPYVSDEASKLTEKNKAKLFNIHTVNQGETLFSISKRYGVPVSDLIEDNPGVDPSKMAIGREILVRKKGAGEISSQQLDSQPEEYVELLNAVSTDFRYHLVKKGETVYGIARQYDMAEQDLTDNNDLSGGLKAGTIIKVPRVSKVRKTAAAPSQPDTDKLLADLRERERLQAEEERLKEETRLRQQQAQAQAKAEQERMASEQYRQEQLMREQRERAEAEARARQLSEEQIRKQAEEERARKEQETAARLEQQKQDAALKERQLMEQLQRQQSAKDTAAQEKLAREAAERERMAQEQKELEDRIAREKRAEEELKARQRQELQDRLDRERKAGEERRRQAAPGTAVQLPVAGAVAGTPAPGQPASAPAERKSGALDAFDSLFKYDPSGREIVQQYPPAPTDRTSTTMWPFFRRSETGATAAADISDRQTINVALMLPLEGAGAENYLDFYQGVMLALEELKNQGTSVRMALYNTPRTAYQVSPIVESMDFENTDLVIGPVYEESLKPVLQFAERKGVAVVSPLAEVKWEKSPLLYQMTPDPRTKNRKLKEILTPGSNVVYVSTNAPDPVIENELRPDMPAGTRYVQYSTTARSSPDFFSGYLEKRGDNIFVVSCTDETTVDNILASISAIYSDQKARSQTQATLRVVGSPRWPRFNKNIIDRKLFFRVGLCYVPNYHADRSDPLVREFDRRYIAAFGDIPTLYSYRGYDAAKLFIGSATVPGSDYTVKLNSHAGTLLQVPYRFVQSGPGDTYVNDLWPLVCYGTDYTITVK